MGLFVGGSPETTDSVLVVEVLRLADAGLLGRDVVHELLQRAQLTSSVAAQDPDPHLIVTHPMDDDLLDNFVMETEVFVALNTSHRHPAHVCSGRHPGHKSSDGLVRLLEHPPQVHEVN